MAKRSAVRRIRAEYDARDGRSSGGVHLNVIEGGWDPVSDDQNYVPRKKKRPVANDQHNQQQQHREPPREQAYVKNIQDRKSVV